MVAPNDERRRVRGQVEAVCGADRLAARVDHGPYGSDEGVAALGFRQRLVGAPHLHRLIVAEAPAAEELDNTVPPVLYECREQGRHHVLGPWQGGEAEDPVHLAAQAPGVDKYQALTTLGELIGKLQGYSTTEGLPDHGCPVDAEEVEEVPYNGGEVAERVVAGRFLRRPVPGEVRGQHRVVALQQAHGGDPRERAAGDAVEQQQHRALTTTAVADLVAVDRDVFDCELFCGGDLLHGLDGPVVLGIPARRSHICHGSIIPSWSWLRRGPKVPISSTAQVPIASRSGASSAIQVWWQVPSISEIAFPTRVGRGAATGASTQAVKALRTASGSRCRGCWRPYPLGCRPTRQNYGGDLIHLGPGRLVPRVPSTREVSHDHHIVIHCRLRPCTRRS